jgi:RimJ/RimL family protein N-acetyltransferase
MHVSTHRTKGRGEVMAIHSPIGHYVEMAVTMLETSTAAALHPDWKAQLPVLQAKGITLRELQVGDAASLLSLLTSDEVTLFISPLPTTMEGFERFIHWSRREREAGRYACFAVVPDGYDTAIGLFQVRQLDSLFDTVEWGFALAPAFRGSGLFVKGAELVIEFAFGVAGAHRLEARVAVRNGRGNSALRKIGAVEEGILRQSFRRGGLHHDQSLWSILREDWYRSKAVWGSKVS